MEEKRINLPLAPAPVPKERKRIFSMIDMIAFAQYCRDNMWEEDSNEKVADALEKWMGENNF